MRAVIVCLVCAGCGRIGFDEGIGADAAGRLEQLPWGPAKQLAVPSPSGDDPTMRSDLLELYFNVASTDIYVTTRIAVDAPWTAPQLVVELDGAAEAGPELSADGLSLIFTSNRMPTLGNKDIWITTRASWTSPWNPPAQVTELSSSRSDHGGEMSGDQLILVFDSTRKGNADDDLYITSRSAIGDAWQPPNELAALNVVGATDESPCLSDDGLTLYFNSNRSGNEDLYVSQRASRDEPFTIAEPIAELNTPDNQTDVWISDDQHHMVFYSKGTLYEAYR
jgi:hypothetical protein